MSVSRALTIHCDKCNTWIGSLEDQPLSLFRRVARRIGWTSTPRSKGHRGTHDLCPKCTKELKK